MRSASIIKEDEEIVGVVEEVFYGSTLQRLQELVEDKSQGDRVVPMESVEMYEIIAKMGPDVPRKEEAMVSTKYKTVEKKVKPAAGPLPADSVVPRDSSPITISTIFGSALRLSSSRKFAALCYHRNRHSRAQPSGWLYYGTTQRPTHT